MLLTLHSLTPHDHHDGVGSAVADAKDTESLSDWLQLFFDQDLGEDHLAHYTQAPNQLDQLDLALLPVLMVFHSFVSQADLTEEEQTFFLSLSDSPREDPILSDSPLRAPPTRA